ncbi:MAG: hypothetical protein IPM47_21160 [Sphingobacteriales bacterium]|nr:MAG: hypothetical protein IPM47_21160 [Sphingobacteriales bacterium]
MTNLLSRLVILLLVCAATFTMQAQEYWSYEWSKYNLSFILPNDFKEVTNTADEFTAVGDGMEIAIFPFNDASIEHSDITSYTISIAKAIELGELDDVDVLEMNGLKGAFVEGYKDGDRIILLGFIDPVSATNFFATITFGDADEAAEDEAVRIISSIRRK